MEDIANERNVYSDEQKAMYKSNYKYNLSLLMCTYSVPIILNFLVTLVLTLVLMFSLSTKFEIENYVTIILYVITIAANLARMYVIRSFKFENNYFNIAYKIYYLPIIINIVSLVVICSGSTEFIALLLDVFVYISELIALAFIYKGYNKVLEDNNCKYLKNHIVPLLIVLSIQTVFAILTCVSNGFVLLEGIFGWAFLYRLYKLYKNIKNTEITIVCLTDSIFEKVCAVITTVIVVGIIIVTGVFSGSNSDSNSDINIPDEAQIKKSMVESVNVNRSYNDMIRLETTILYDDYLINCIKTYDIELPEQAFKVGKINVVSNTDNLVNDLDITGLDIQNDSEIYLYFFNNTNKELSDYSEYSFMFYLVNKDNTIMLLPASISEI